MGSIRLEPQKPTVCQIGSNFHFGASTRYYTLRERIKAQNIVEDLPVSSELLIQSQDEVNNLTEYNTAHNRKISTLGIVETNTPKKGAKRKRVHFNEEEIIINPEDVDDSIGRFRNLVHSTVVPVSNKRVRLMEPPSSVEHKTMFHHPIISAPSLYSDLPSTSNEGNRSDESFGLYSSKIMPSLLPNPAPEIDSISTSTLPTSSSTSASQVQFKHDEIHDHQNLMNELEPKKKKYAKESWHGPKKLAKAFGDI
jgi:nuclear inhibitor of protein phosphatase 1